MDPHIALLIFTLGFLALCFLGPLPGVSEEIQKKQKKNRNFLAELARVLIVIAFNFSLGVMIVAIPVAIFIIIF